MRKWILFCIRGNGNVSYDFLNAFNCCGSFGIFSLLTINILQIITSIQNHIYDIRGERVFLDDDIAVLYEVLTKALNQAVKRNSDRFPKDFMFQLSEEEFKKLNHVHSTKTISFLRSQSVTLKAGRGQHRKYLPYTFTEQGVLRRIFRPAELQ